MWQISIPKTSPTFSFAGLLTWYNIIPHYPNIFVSVWPWLFVPHTHCMTWRKVYCFYHSLWRTLSGDTIDNLRYNINYLEARKISIILLPYASRLLIYILIKKQSFLKSRIPWFKLCYAQQICAEWTWTLLWSTACAQQELRQNRIDNKMQEMQRHLLR